MNQARQAKMGGFLVVAIWAGAALAQAPAGSGSIYTCTDANGRRITADRPIATCVDREQRVLGNTGVELRRVAPTQTEQERNAYEARRRQELADQARLREERSRDKAMLLRYPNQASHDAARNEALSQSTDVSAVAQMRLGELKQRRKKIDTELEFYQGNPAKAPASLRRQIKDNTESQEEQQRFIQQQEEEQQRINQRFDAELQQLRKLWGQTAANPAR